MVLLNYNVEAGRKHRIGVIADFSLNSEIWTEMMQNLFTLDFKLASRWTWGESKDTSKLEMKRLQLSRVYIYAKNASKNEN